MNHFKAEFISRSIEWEPEYVGCNILDYEIKNRQYIARNLKRNHEIKRFVPLNSIVIYELTMFNYNKQCHNLARFYTTKKAYTIANFNEK